MELREELERQPVGKGEAKRRQDVNERAIELLELCEVPAGVIVLFDYLLDKGRTQSPLKRIIREYKERSALRSVMSFDAKNPDASDVERAKFVATQMYGNADSYETYREKVAELRKDPRYLKHVADLRERLSDG